MSRKESLRPRPVAIENESKEDNKIIEDESDIEDNNEEIDYDSTDEKSVVKARVLSAREESGKSIFGFKTPKRKEALVKAAQESVHSIKKSGKHQNKTSIRRAEKPNVHEEVKTSGKERGGKEEKSQYRAGQINVITSSLNEVEASSNSDESEEDDEEEEPSDGESSTKKDVKTCGDILDEYFEAHHNKKRQITSDKTLSKLANPKMEQEELREHLKEVKSRHVDETIRLRDENMKYFDKWMFQMLCGFNILIYGVGSKYNLLDVFRRNFLKDELHIVINGFFPSLLVKQILNLITDDLLETDNSFKSLIDQAAYISKHFDEGEEKLFLVVNNIDGHTLRGQNTQAVLGQLASSRNIHMIASIDHINAALIWDQNRCSVFNWLWYDATTFEPYSEETSYENSLMVQQTGTLALSSLTHVMRSLTPNAKGIFHLLMQYHQDHEDNSNYTGMTFNELYSKCREGFLVNSDANLRAQLTEFKDHKLLKVKKGYDGVEYLSVTLDVATIKQYMETL